MVSVALHIGEECQFSRETVVLKADSVADIVSAADREHKATTAPGGDLCGFRWDFVGDGAAGFVGRRFNCVGDVWRAASSPWKEGEDIVLAMREEICRSNIAPPMSRRRTRRWSESDGDSIDLDRMRSGAKFWDGREHKSKVGPKTVRIVADVCASSKVPSESILWRGAAALVLADALEHAGYRVELSVAAGMTSMYYGSDLDGGAAGLLVIVNIKDGCSPINVSSLSSAVSGWFFRSVILSACSVGNFEKKWRVDSGLGFPANPKLLHKSLNRLLGEEMIFLSDVWSKDAAIAAVRNALGGFEN